MSLLWCIEMCSMELCNGTVYVNHEYRYPCFEQMFLDTPFRGCEIWFPTQLYQTYLSAPIRTYFYPNFHENLPVAAYLPTIEDHHNFLH